MTQASLERNDLNEGESSGLRLIREDALPEHIQYRDEGCELSPSCLKCPLPFCRYDHPGGLRHIRNRGRDSEIIRLRYRERLPINALARRFGVSRRTVFRVLKRANRETARQRRGCESSTIDGTSEMTGAS
jgi:AraC-like DNA-binding protein